ncbi:MAG: YlxR family protein [Clostridiales bacterium]|nr:MAG: YlxR family protein [Clostridiales bacterium]
MPVRTCIGCGKKGGKADFIKIVKNKNGEVFVDADKENFGRGAYICRDAKMCCKKRKKRTVFRAR